MATERRAPQSSRFRSALLIGFGVLFILFLSASGIARLYTDWWWFSNLGQLDVWTTILSVRITLAVVFSLLFFALLWTNLYLADRFAPPFLALTPEEDLIERYHALIGPHAGRIRVGIAGALALIVGFNTSQQWETWLLFRNGGDFGVVDPLFNRDAGFYVFRLPFWSFLVGWVFAALGFTLLLTLIAHYLNGGIRASAPRERVSGRVKLHLSVLLALLAVVRSFAYYLDRFKLVNAQRGAYDGALATDVQVQLPALNLLAVISLFGAGLFVANIRRKGWGLPAVALGVWLVSHIVVGTMLPSLYQRFRVEVEESTRERDFIGDNISATRFAYGLDDSKLTTETFSYSSTLSAETVSVNQTILDDVSLLDPSLADAPFKRIEGDVQAFDFAEVLDVDRYEINGELEPVVLGVRELDLATFPKWEASHIAMTHGYGVAVAAANGVDNGLPDFLVSGVGDDQRLGTGFEGQLEQPQIYYSEGLTGYALVGANRDEVDYPATPEAKFRYDGNGGVSIGSIFRKTMFSLRFQQYQPMISPFLGSDTKVIYNRDINTRVRELAPFLEFDSDPYPVLAEGRVFWVIDAYTTTDKFPYSQQVKTESFVGGADLRTGFNYVRNSVKAVVDAYNGDVSFYIVDDADPVVAAYSEAFPDLFTPVSEAPESVAEHFRYPTDLFKVQTDMWGRYQVSDPVQFLEEALFWQVTRAPDSNASIKAGSATTSTGGPMAPQYRTTILPGSDATEFVLQRAFEPRSNSAENARPELRSILVARSDGEHYGELIQYLLPEGKVVAPELVDSSIRVDTDISGFITPLDLSGSSVIFGEMQLVLIGESLIYVRPLYVKADAATAPPELQRIIVSDGRTVAMAETLDEAVAILVDSSESSSTDDQDDSQDDDPEESGSDSEDADPDDDDDGGSGSDNDPATTPPSSVDLDGLSVAELFGLIDAWTTAAEEAEAEGEIETAAEFRAKARETLDKLGEVLGVDPKASIQDSGDA